MSAARQLTPLLPGAMLIALGACGNVTATSEGEGKVCALHESQACVCPEGGSGLRYCSEDEQGWGSCHCDLPDAASTDLGAGVDAGDGGAVDAGSPLADAATPHDAAPPHDAASGYDAARPDYGYVDSARPDTSPPPSDAALLPDLAAATDSAPARDSAVPAGLGTSCNDSACPAPLLCVGDPGAYFCRLPCTLGGGQCNPVTEHCIELNGTSQRACVPGVGLGASCDSLPCADLYVCVAAGGSGYTCHLACDPDAADPGCPYGTTCQAIGGLSTGGCL